MRVLQLCLLVNALVYSYAFPNLVDLLGQLNTTTLLNLVNQAGLTDTLREGGPFTILAPTDAAFARIPKDDLDPLLKDTQKLGNVLQYHVLNGMLFLFDLRTNEQLMSLNNHKIRVYINGHQHLFNQALAIKEEIQASNGVVYLIDEVLNVPEGSVLDIINNPDYNTSMFMDLLKKTHLDRTLNSTYPGRRYTVFAPSNAAFSSLPPSILHTIQNNYVFARQLVEYHIHSGTLHSSSLAHDGSVSTMHAGHYITVKHDSTTGEPLLNSVAHVNIDDIEGENGVVHVISHVLIPTSLAPIVG